MNVNFVDDVFAPTIDPDVTLVNTGKNVEFVAVLSVIETAAEAQVLSPRKNVVASAVPEASLAGATVPVAMLFAFNEVKFAPLTAPKEPDHVPEVIVPVDVSDDVTTEDPNVVALKMSTLLILYVCPDPMLMLLAAES